MPSLRFSLSLLTLVTGFAASSLADPQALIIVGLSAGDSQASRLNENAQAIRTSLIARGIAPDAIRILGGNDSPRVRRDQILDSLRALAAIPADTPSDERWVVLLGTSNSRNGEASFQVSGPRLSASDLAAAVKLLPGGKRVVIGTSSSGGFLPPLLDLPYLEAVAATADSGEVNEPRFIEEWTNALAAAPLSSFGELAAIAAERVKAFYDGASLAQGENARLIFHPPYTGDARSRARVIEAPFPHVDAANAGNGVDKTKATPKAVASTPPPAAPAADNEPTGISVSDIQIPKPKGDGDIERRPATDESRALLADARESTRTSQYAALFLRVDKEVTVGRDFAVFERHRFRAYLRTGEALDDLGTLWLPSEKGYITRLESARVITPDGSQILVNPKTFDARRAEETREQETARAENKPTGPEAPPFLPLPEVTAGCIVEAEWTTERTNGTEMPQFTQEWSLAEQYPIRALYLTVTTPNEANWRTFAPNLPAPIPPAAITAHSKTSTAVPAVELAAPTAKTRTRRWTLTDVDALNIRVGDAPARTTIPWVGVSSLDSWDAFAAWYLRLAEGSTETGPGVALLADEIARAHPKRIDRLRAAYERVAALRYVSFPLGVGAIRARTPEQVWKQRYGDCKDKAGLLVAVLGKLGITAEFALVNRFDHTFTEWPAWQFNHAVARVPAAPADGQPLDLWLDTTDRLVPFGIVAPGDLGRDAFAFNAEGKATFHRITVAQEPQSIWDQTALVDKTNKTVRLFLRSHGGAEIKMRQLFASVPESNRLEFLRSRLAWDLVLITRVTANDPYDLSVPFEATVEGRLTGDPASVRPPRMIIPGIEQFYGRYLYDKNVLWWDEGRSWSVYQGFGDSGRSFKVRGFNPALRTEPAADGSTITEGGRFRIFP